MKQPNPQPKKVSRSSAKSKDMNPYTMGPDAYQYLFGYNPKTGELRQVSVRIDRKGNVSNKSLNDKAKKK